MAWPLAPATLVGFLAFASYTNRQPMCDALSPVWLTVMLAAGGAAVFVGLVRDPRPLVRLGAARGRGGWRSRPCWRSAFRSAWAHPNTPRPNSSGCG